eukprot:366000-Chlamydomonas_euryale.AAC.37
MPALSKVSQSTQAIKAQFKTGQTLEKMMRGERCGQACTDKATACSCCPMLHVDTLPTPPRSTAHLDKKRNQTAEETSKQDHKYGGDAQVKRVLSGGNTT